MTNPSTSARQRQRCLRPAVATLGLALAVSMAPGAAAVAAPAAGEPRAEKEAVDSALHALQEDLVGTSAELTDAYAEYAAVQEELPGAERAADLARQVQEQAQEAADDLANRLAASEEARTAAATAVEETEASMADSQVEIGRIAASAYRSRGVPEGLAMAMGSASTADFASRSAAVEGLSSAEADTLAALGSDEAVRRSASTRLVAVTDQVAGLKAQAEQQLRVATDATTAAEARQAEVESLVARQEQAVATIEDRQSEEQERLDQLQAESDSLGAQLRAIAEQEAAAAEAARQAAASAPSGSGAAEARSAAPSAASRSVRDSGGTLLRPEGRITSPFGMRMHPIRGYMRMHSGQDFAAGCGAPIRAAEAGEIVSAGYNGSYGNIPVINHGVLDGQPVATAYAHMQSFTKTSGSVQRGEVIGYEGTTGGSTGCHLHLEVRVNGAPVDPMGWL